MLFEIISTINKTIITKINKTINRCTIDGSEPIKGHRATDADAVTKI